MYADYKEKLVKTRGKDKSIFVELQELHSLTSVFKAIATWQGETFGEQMKQACGGHGFMQMSGLTRDCGGRQHCHVSTDCQALVESTSEREHQN
jgi:alkylation response protein AidB-like acyl-CoA dehydrogenase